MTRKRAIVTTAVSLVVVAIVALLVAYNSDTTVWSRLNAVCINVTHSYSTCEHLTPTPAFARD